MMTYRVVLTKITHSMQEPIRWAPAYSKNTALSKNQKAKRKNKFSMLHLNMGSLPKNISLLEDFITTVNVPPGIIAISETKFF